MGTGFFWILLALAVYGLLHSLLASQRAKAFACRLNQELARRFYRLFYNLFVSVTFVPVLALVAFLPDAPVYRAPFPVNLAMILGQVLAVVGLGAGLLQTDLGSFVGLAQLRGEHASLCNPEGRDPRGQLVTSGLYRWVRHPLYSCGLLFLWLTPVMTMNVLALNLGVTVYILIGAKLEERKLLAEFGPAYAEYMRCTPMLLPGMKR